MMKPTGTNVQGGKQKTKQDKGKTAMQECFPTEKKPLRLTKKPDRLTRTKESLTPNKPNSKPAMVLNSKESNDAQVGSAKTYTTVVKNFPVG